MKLVPGQRVLQWHHNNPADPTPPGSEGVVLTYDTATETAVIEWDTGERQTVAPDAPFIPLTSTWVPAAGAGLTLGEALDAIRSAGAATGRAGAEQWWQEAVASGNLGRARADAAAILRAIGADDPERIEGIPLCVSASAAPLAELPCETDLVFLMTDPAGPRRMTVSTEDWEHATYAYCDAYDGALLDRLTQLCRAVLTPAAEIDLQSLHPRSAAVGQLGVFSGNWLASATDPDRYRIAYAGTLTRWWNGWAVFAGTRSVVDAVVADQQRERARYRTDLTAQRQSSDAVELAVDQEYARLEVDVDALVVDQRRQLDDPEAIQRITAHGGSYEIGWGWQWEAVDPLDCDEIAGLPGPTATS